MIDAPAEPFRVSIVSGLCNRHDAISESVVGTWHAIHREFGVRPRLYAYSCEFPEIDYKVVGGLSEVLLDDHFNGSHLIIYHFGIYYELFNSILLAPPSAKKVVRYHNVTPANFLAPSQAPVIARSRRQIASIAAADAVWADSAFNREDLIDYGLDAANISVEPLYVRSSLDIVPRARANAGGIVEILFVGRFVKSKGLLDLVAAAALARDRIGPVFRIRLVGNTTFSDKALLTRLADDITTAGLEEIVELVGGVSDAALADHYSQADLFLLPSYHEGFCVPVIEAMTARAIPIVYDAGNLANIIGNFGVTVATADIAALGEAIADCVTMIRNDADSFTLNGSRWTRDGYEAAISRYLDEFTFDAFASRLGARVAAMFPSLKAQ